MTTLRLPFLYPFLVGTTKTSGRNTLADTAKGFTPGRQQKRAVSTPTEPRSSHSATVFPLESFLQTSRPSARSEAASQHVPGSSNSSNSSSNSSPATSSNSNVRSRPTSRSVNRSQSPSRSFRTSTRRRRPEVASQRFTTGNEPPLGLVTIPPDRLLPNKEAVPTQRRLPEPPNAPRGDPAKAKGNVPTQPQAAQPLIYKDLSTGLREAAANASIIPPNPNSTLGGATAKLTAAGQTTSTAQSTAQSANGPATNETALSTILRMEADGGAEKPPHLVPPPYVHHFDTFTVVGDLEKGGFTVEQAVNLMKLMRLVLADNVDLARDGILSRADAEMSAYLFRAASSELRHEIRNTRSSTTENARASRTQMQHEVDILSQRITTDTTVLKDEIKGMFEDRKLAVRVERRDVENKIQELGYRITTRLQSEMRSVVEGMRWSLVRRVALAVASVVATAVMSLRASRYKAQREVKREAERKSLEEQGRNADPAAVGLGFVAEAGKEGGLVRGMKVGDDVNPDLVSLG